MKIKVLGTAAGGGVPQWNCACDNCIAARDGKIPHRCVASIAVSGGDNGWLLVNASCDINRQIAATPQLFPAMARTSPVTALLLTDANIDHTAGVLEFRQSVSFTIYSSRLVRRTLCSQPMFAQFARRNKQWRTFDDGARAPVDVVEAPHLRVTAVPVPGLLPSYAGGKRKRGAAVAYVFEEGRHRCVYAPIFLELDDGLKQELEKADAVLLDGTCWNDEELVELGLGERTSRAMGHAPMWGSEGSLSFARTLQAKHRYYTHVNNTNPILDPASVPANLLAQTGFSVAPDGLEILLDASGA